MVGLDDHAAAILRVDDVHKHYRLGGQDLHVLQGVSLTVRPRESVAILGSSGSGKSTLLHLLGGLDRADAGSIHFHGQNVGRLRANALDRYRQRHVGFVFQAYHLLPELTALENVMIAAMTASSVWAWPTRRRPVRQRAEALLDRVGLGQRLRHRPSRLSGGERQRVAIARALVNQPDLLLADEPTGNLDEQTGGHILELLTGLHEQGQTVVTVTHEARVANAADRRLRLEHGRLVPLHA